MPVAIGLIKENFPNDKALNIIKADAKIILKASITFPLKRKNKKSKAVERL
jgi:hypothetical protein